MSTQGRFFYRPDFKARSYEEFFKFDQGLAAADAQLSRVIAPLLEDKAYYISPTGSDLTGDGSGANPFATINGVLSVLPDNLGGRIVDVFCGDGTYSGNFVSASKFNGYIRIQSSSADRTKVLFQGDGENAPFYSVLGGTFIVLLLSKISVRVTGDYGSCVMIDGGVLVCDDIALGDNDSVSTLGIFVHNSSGALSNLSAIDSKKVAYGLVFNNCFIGLADNSWSTIGDVASSGWNSFICDANNFLLTPFSAPTVDYEVANKKYVDSIPRYIQRTPLPTSHDKILSDMTFDLSLHDLDLSAIIPAGVVRSEIRVAISAPESQSFVIIRKNFTSLLAESKGTTAYFLGASNYGADVTFLIPTQADRKFSYYGTTGTWSSFGLVVLGWEK